MFGLAEELNSGLAVGYKILSGGWLQISTANKQEYKEQPYQESNRYKKLSIKGQI